MPKIIMPFTLSERHFTDFFMANGFTLDSLDADGSGLLNLHAPYPYLSL